MRKFWIMLTIVLGLLMSACATEENNIADTSVVEQPTQISSETQTEEIETVAETETGQATEEEHSVAVFDYSSVEPYRGEAYTVVNDNIPFFEEGDLFAKSYEYYGEQDSLGRCGVCRACIGIEIMPTEGREGNITLKPAGWQNVEYKGVVEGGYLYNRCHLIGYQLTGEVDNRKNLITGTRRMNMEGMLPFERLVENYIKQTENHVLYRVTPVYSGENILADGVLMEAQSIEDQGEGVRFCVFCYNVQPGVAINYLDGSSKLDGTIVPEPETPEIVAEKPSESTGGQEANVEKPAKPPVTKPSESNGVQETDKEKPSGDTGNQGTIAEKPAGSSGGQEAVAENPTINTKPEETKQGEYVVNGKNGKIHKNGGCAATGSGKNAMKEPLYFETYEEAEECSKRIAKGLKNRKCGNCW